MAEWLTQDVPLWHVFVAVIAATIGARAWADTAEYLKRRRERKRRGG